MLTGGHFGIAEGMVNSLALAHGEVELVGKVFIPQRAPLAISEGRRKRPFCQRNVAAAGCDLAEPSQPWATAARRTASAKLVQRRICETLYSKIEVVRPIL